MWTMTLNMDSIINLSLIGRISVVAKVGGGYVLMAYPDSIGNSGFVIGEYKTKADAKEALVDTMGKMNGRKVP